MLSLRKREADAEKEFGVQMFTASNTCKRYIDDEQKFVQQTFPTMMPTKGKGNKHHTVEISKGPLNPLERCWAKFFNGGIQ